MIGFLFSFFLNSAAPEIEVSEPSFDFGYAFDGENYRHTFWIYNTGDAPLNIQNVRTFCGCSITELAKRRLEPGDSTSFDFTYDTKGFYGNCVKWAYIHSDAPNDSLLKINVTIKLYGGYDLTPIGVEPEFLHFNRIDSLRGELALRLVNNSRTEYDLKLLEIPEALEDFSLPQSTLGPGEVINLTLHPKHGTSDYTLFHSSLNFEAWTPTEIVRFSVPLHIRSVQ